MLLPIVWVDLISLFVKKHIDFQLVSNAPTVKAHHLATKGTLKKERKSLIETRLELFSDGEFKKTTIFTRKDKVKIKMREICKKITLSSKKKL